MRELDTPTGNFFEDFTLGQLFQHGVPRTISESDATLYLALTGSRYALHCAETVAQASGFNRAPLDNFLVFHIAFGKTVNDVSLNAVANLGYAEIVFQQPCFAGDTLSVSSEVIGLKQNSNGKTGIVYVRSKAVNQHNQAVVSWIRWVMVNCKQPSDTTHEAVIPTFEPMVAPQQLTLQSEVNFNHWQDHLSDHQRRYADFEVGDRIFHRDGLTINDSDHSLATRLYQNNARVHFDQHLMDKSPHGKRLVYGGHIISLCRALSYNGLGNSLLLAAINGGTHANPSFAGDTIYCQSEILDKVNVADRDDVGLCRVRMLGIKNDTPENMPYLVETEAGRSRYHSNLVLDLDYWTWVLK